jgi:predicted DNA binding CopG/RHH family protein
MSCTRLPTATEGAAIDELERALASLEPSDSERETTFEPTYRLSLDVDVFLEQQARRAKVLKMQDAVRPGHTTPIALRLDRFTIQRLKAIAALRGTGYQTLLKQFVVERLYEEEKRVGIIDG